MQGNKTEIWKNDTCAFLLLLCSFSLFAVWNIIYMCTYTHVKEGTKNYSEIRKFQFCQGETRYSVALEDFWTYILQLFCISIPRKFSARVESKDTFPSFNVYRAPNKTQIRSGPPDAAIILNRNNCLYCTMQHLLTDNLWNNLENYAVLFPPDIYLF